MTTELEGQSAVTRTLATSSSTNRLSVAAYDLSGNVTSWAGRQYRFDAFNMLTQEKPTAGNGHTFLYGPGDERIATIDWTAGTGCTSWVETWTLRDLDGTPLRQFRGGGCNDSTADWSFDRDHVYRNGALLAAHAPQGIRHFHLDHLGSPRLITDATGTTLAQHLYFPLGEEATDPGQDAGVLKFTGHEFDDVDAGGSTTDLYYAHARYLSAHLGRFQSFDPIGGNPTEPQSWNRYSYVLGNPLKYTDPRGLIFESLDDIYRFIFFDVISVTDEPLGFDPFTGVQGLNGLILGRLAMALTSTAGPEIRRVAELRVFFHRPEVTQFAACVEQRGTGQGEGDPEGTGYWVQSFDGKEAGVYPTVVDFGRTPEGRTSIKIVVPDGAVANFHTHTTGRGGFRPSPADRAEGARRPVFVLHKPTGVRLYEAGLSENGVPVARAGWYRGRANRAVCRQYQ